MYVHQALPKDLNSLAPPSYEIKKKSSPKEKLTPRIHKEISEQYLIKHCSSEKNNLHHIGSKEKPHLNSLEKPIQPVLSKPIYSICHKKQENKLDDSRQSPSKRQKNERKSIPKRDVVICRIENKFTRPANHPFCYADFTQIDPSFCHIYEG